MLPEYYEFYNPVKINAGREALETIPYELKLLNAERPLVITDKGIVNAGLLKIFLEGFNDSEIVIGTIYDETPPDSSLETVNEIVRLYKKNNCDSIIAVGGGSAIDTAKGVNIVISEGDDDLRKFMGADRVSKPQKPFIVVPTTAGTGSEVTLVAVIADKKNNVKMPFTSNLLLPKVAILDPRMTLTLPARITAATGMDALTHAVEAYTCLQKNPMSDAYAFAAINLIRENIIRATQKGSDKKARFAMANASMMAGTAFSNSMVGAVHAIGHACGAVAHVHHGNAMAVLLPYVMKYNSDKIGDLYADLLLPLAGNEIYAATPKRERARKSIETVLLFNHQLYKICGMPVRLKDAGVTENQFDKIAEKALNDGAMLPNPKDMNTEQIVEILKEAF